MGKLKCYYAHTMLSYGSTIEQGDLDTLESLGFEVLNPNQEWVREGVKKFMKDFPDESPMKFFDTLIKQCDVLAFRGNPNGKILSGVAYEIQFANEIQIPIIELPSSLSQRMYDYPTTKQYLIEIGHYKVKK